MTNDRNDPNTLGPVPGAYPSPVGHPPVASTEPRRDGAGAPSPATPTKHRPRRVFVAAAVIAALGALGGGYAAVRFGESSTNTSQAAGNQAATSTGGTAGQPGAGVPTGAAAGAVAGDAGSFTAPPHGTVVSTTSSTLTVKLSSGATKTYTLASKGTVTNNGSTSSLTALTAGEKVVVLTGFPGAASNSTSADTVLAGTSATSGPVGGPGQQAAGAQGS